MEPTKPVTDTPESTPATDTTASPSPLLVTSSSSRSQYADNEAKLNSTVSNLPASNTYSYVDTTGAQKTTQAASPEQAIANAPNIDPHSGVAALPGPGQDGVTKPADTAATPKAPVPAKANPDGSTNNPDGTVTTADGVRLAPGLVSTYNDTTKQLDQGIAQAKGNLAAAAATLQNDPAASAAVALVMQKYDQQIAAMKEKNRLLAGGNIVNAARSGSLQFANEMTSNFLSDEQDRASKRVTDLITLETEMVLKTQEAYKKGDVAAFDASSKALDKAQSDKTKAISDLLKATDTVVKEQQAQAKIDATAKKQAITDDLRLSTGIANTIAQNLAAAGIKDEKKRRAYIEGMAEQNGITNSDILDSAVAKAALATKNTESIISKRNSTSSKTSPTATKNTVLANITARFGDQNKNDTGYSVRGDDGYIDPGEYVNAYKQWTTKYPDKEFLTKFPVKTLVNPDSYDALPAALRPAATKTKAPA